jgi:hypothetical protein
MDSTVLHASCIQQGNRFHGNFFNRSIRHNRFCAAVQKPKKPEIARSRRYISNLYARAPGLIRDIPGRFEPANPIYAEVIVRTLSHNAQDILSDGKTVTVAGC